MQKKRTYSSMASNEKDDFTPTVIIAFRDKGFVVGIITIVLSCVSMVYAKVGVRDVS